MNQPAAFIHKTAHKTIWLKIMDKEIDMKITIELLEKMPNGARACDEAQEWFKETFPSGGKLKEVWNACPEPEWKIWFTCNYVDADVRQKLAYKFAGQAFRYAAKLNPELAEYADNVNEENTLKARDAARAARGAAWAAAWAAGEAWAARGAAWATAREAWATARDEQIKWCEEVLGIENS